MKPPFMPSEPPERLSPLVLAYVGDAVLELIVRLYLVCGPRRRPDDLNREAVRWVSAKGQAELWERWAPFLTDEEREMARKGGMPHRAERKEAPAFGRTAQVRHSSV